MPASKPMPSHSADPLPTSPRNPRRSPTMPVCGYALPFPANKPGQGHQERGRVVSRMRARAIGMLPGRYAERAGAGAGSAAGAVVGGATPAMFGVLRLALCRRCFRHRHWKRRRTGRSLLLPRQIWSALRRGVLTKWVQHSSALAPASARQDQRRDRKAARTSAVNTSGSSQAAKCPPLSARL